MLLAAIADDNPVMFVESKLLYKVKGPVPEQPYIVPLGQVRLEHHHRDGRSRRKERVWERNALRTDPKLARQLCQAYNLAEAHVLAEPPEDYGLLLRRLGEMGARRLQETLHPGIIIGLSWGTGVHSVVSAMRSTPVPDATVVQLIGAVGHGDPMVDGLELARWLANPTSCVFGGPGLTDLYVTTAWLGLNDAERRAAPGSGDLYVVHTDIRGLPAPKSTGRD